MQIHGAISSLTQSLAVSVNFRHFFLEFLDPVIVSSCIFLENETSLTKFDTIVDKVSIFLMCVFHFNTHILPTSFLYLISYFKTTDKLS